MNSGNANKLNRKHKHKFVFVFATHKGVDYGTKMETNVFIFTLFFLVRFSFFPQFLV